MDVRVSISAKAASTAAANCIAELISEVIESRGSCNLALSGGRTPQQMLRSLATRNLAWHALHIFQVDERVAPHDDAARNLTQLRQRLLRRTAIPLNQVHAMPVEYSNLELAATNYSVTLAAIAGDPPVLDIVQLGLGADGHTASLLPGDPVLQGSTRSVAVTQAYAGHRRLTLTFECLARSRNRVWLVTGTNKSAALAQLFQPNSRMAASQLAKLGGMFFVDCHAAARLSDNLRKDAGNR